jgi:hypothetical protein
VLIENVLPRRTLCNIGTSGIGRRWSGNDPYYLNVCSADIEHILRMLAASLMDIGSLFGRVMIPII